MTGIIPHDPKMVAALRDPARVKRAKDLLRLSLLSPQSVPAGVTDLVVAQMVEAMTVPAEPAWISARVLSLLLPYYDKDAPQSVRKMDAEDWVDALSPYPKWAISEAVKWWRGPDNPKRRHRPFEGDIVARVRVEMDAVLAMKIRMDAGLSLIARPQPEPERGPRITPERAAEIMAEVGWKGAAPQPKTFGGGAGADA